jgi:hypothetical protein
MKANADLLAFDDEVASLDAAAGNQRFYPQDFLARYLKESYGRWGPLLRAKMRSMHAERGRTGVIGDALDAKHLDAGVAGLETIAVMSVLEYLVRRNVLLEAPSTSASEGERTAALARWYMHYMIAMRDVAVLTMAWPAHTIWALYEELGRRVVPNNLVMEPAAAVATAMHAVSGNPQLGHSLKHGFALSAETALAGWAGAAKRKEQPTKDRAPRKERQKDRARAVRAEFNPDSPDFVPKPWCHYHWSKSTECRRGDACHMRHLPKWTQQQLAEAKKTARAARASRR